MGGNETQPLTLALDVMGGENAPFAVVDAANYSLTKTSGLRFILFGDERKIKKYVDRYPLLIKHSDIVHTEDVIADHDKVSQAVRQGKNSSMRLAINAVKEGKAAAVISSGNTGALMAMSKIVLRTLPGIDRPAIVSLLPTTIGKSVMLDLGANIECSAENLFQFAVMGDAFARATLEIDSPTVAILNVGEEELKGNGAVKEAADLLRNTDLPINFYGFVEGDDIAFGSADVIVTDGFTGNIALKTAEGTAKFCRQFFKTGLTRTPFAKMGAVLAKRSLKKTMRKIDPRSYNGAMLIGLNGIAIKSHGSADHKAFTRAIKVAVSIARKDINNRIIEEMKQYHDSLHGEERSRVEGERS